MGLHKNLIFILMVTALLWVGFFALLSLTNPYAGSFITFLLFYILLFLVIASTFITIGLKISHNELKILRRGILFALFVVIIALLQAFRFLTVINFALILIITAVADLLVLSLLASRKKVVPAGRE